jgi:hypothetical protein
MNIPRSVEEAAMINFGIAITGYLYCPQLYGFCLEGVVYFDQKSRFANGRLIRTSAVSEFLDLVGYQVARTFTGSAYVLVGKDGPWEFCFENKASDKRPPAGETMT